MPRTPNRRRFHASWHSRTRGEAGDRALFPFARHLLKPVCCAAAKYGKSVHSKMPFAAYIKRRYQIHNCGDSAMTSSNAVATLPSVDGELNYLKLNGARPLTYTYA